MGKYLQNQQLKRIEYIIQYQFFFKHQKFFFDIIQYQKMYMNISTTKNINSFFYFLPKNTIIYFLRINISSLTDPF